MRILAGELDNYKFRRKKRKAKTSPQPGKGIGAKWKTARTDTITESDKTIATKQMHAEILSDLLDDLDVNKSSCRN